MRKSIFQLVFLTGFPSRSLSPLSLPDVLVWSFRKRGFPLHLREFAPLELTYLFEILSLILHFYLGLVDSSTTAAYAPIIPALASSSTQ